VVCDRRGGRSDCGKSRALVIAIEIEKLSEDSLCNISSPHSLRKPTDPAGSWLAHPPRQPGQISGEEQEKAKIVEESA